MEKRARDLEQDLALCEKATPGPWDKIKRKDGHLYLGTAIKPVVDVCNLYGDESEANLSFIAAAREALPYWLGEVKRLRAVLSDIYPAIAGYAGALDYAGETVAFAEWQKVARKIYEVLEVRNG